MALNNLQPVSAVSKEITNIKTAITKNEDTLVNADNCAALESATKHTPEGYARAEQSFEQVKKLIGDVVNTSVDDMGRPLYDDFALEAGARAIMTLGDSDKFVRSLEKANKNGYTPGSKEYMNSPTYGAHGSIRLADSFALERFNKTKLNKYKSESVELSMRTAKASPFTEMFYPTVQVGADITGVTLSLDRTVIQKNHVNPMTGETFNLGRFNVLRGAIDHTLLTDGGNKLHHGPTAETKDNFLSDTKYKPVKSEDDVVTAPLSCFDRTINLLAHCKIPGAVGNQTYTSNDFVDPGLTLDKVVLSSGNGYFDVEVGHHNSATFAHRTGFGSDTDTVLNFNSSDVYISLDTVNQKDDAEIATLKALKEACGDEGGRLRVRLDVNADFSHSNSDLTLKGKSTPKVLGVFSNDGTGGNLLKTRAETIKPLVDALNLEMEAIILDGTLSNKNLRIRGQKVDSQNVNYMLRLDVKSPDTVDLPHDESDVSEGIKSLGYVRSIMTDSDAVTSVLNQTERLIQQVQASDGLLDEVDPYELGVPGAFMVTPWAERVEININDIIQYVSTDGRTDAISAGIVDILAHAGTRIASETTYLPALRAHTGNPNEKITFGIGTTSLVSRYIFTSGDDRTFGGSEADINKDLVVTTSQDSRMEDTIIMVPIRKSGGSYDLFGYGNRLSGPALVVETPPITTHGQTSKLLQSTRIEQTVQNMPIAFVLKVHGLDAYLKQAAEFKVAGLGNGAPASDVTPESIGAMPTAPEDGARYVGTGTSWVPES